MWALAIHGGAGLIRRRSLTDEREAACRAALAEATRRGSDILAAGGSAVDAVVASTVALEESPWFNAGRGAVFTSHETIEHDAALMRGRDRQAGAVTCTRTIRNPIRAAEALLDSPHVLLAARGAEDFADGRGLERVDPAWFMVQERLDQLRRAGGKIALDHDDRDVYGTVGAVACDAHGHVAAANSTGGMVGQAPGRIGDTPVFGAGTWADDRTCAVAATGHGERFIRAAAASRVAAWMDIGGLDLVDAANKVIHEEVDALGGKGGILTVDQFGTLALPFNAAGMFRGWATEAGDHGTAIWADEPGAL